MCKQQIVYCKHACYNLVARLYNLCFSIWAMHNLLLGTAKHITELWKNQSILTSKDFDKIQGRVNSFVCPSDVVFHPSCRLVFLVSLLNSGKTG